MQYRCEGGALWPFSFKVLNARNGRSEELYIYIYIYVLIESIYRWAGIKVVLLRFLEVVRAVAADGLKLKYTWHLAGLTIRRTIRWSASSMLPSMAGPLDRMQDRLDGSLAAPDLPMMVWPICWLLLRARTCVSPTTVTTETHRRIRRKLPLVCDPWFLGCNQGAHVNSLGRPVGNRYPSYRSKSPRKSYFNRCNIWTCAVKSGWEFWMRRVLDYFRIF
jgi:YD repeat-containing protein